jgi:transmembrane sensor
MPTPNHQIRSAIAQEAAEWFVLNRGGAVSASDRSAFGAWLKTSPLHIEEYLKTAAMSRDLHAATDSLDIDIDSLILEARSDFDTGFVSLWSRGPVENPEIRAASRNRPALLTAIAAAAVLALIGVVWMERDGQRFGLPRTFDTVHGEQRSWLLPDGTRLDLNTDTSVTVRYNRSERLVQIDRGQALFRVAHEDRRRFRVIVGADGVIAVGTEFDVYRKASSTLVTVVEGKVAVYTGGPPPPTFNAALPSQAVSVSAGEQAQISAGSRSAKLSTPNLQQAVGWVQRQIAFEQRPLGAVTEEFNRYSAVSIVVEGDGLRALPISGAFSAYDTASFVSFLSRLNGVQIETSPDRILVFSGASRIPGSATNR